MTPALDIRPETAPPAGAAACAALHAAAFTDAQPPWSEAAFAALADDSLIRRVELHSVAPPELAGLAIWRQLVDEGEILTLCRTPSLAGRGIGRLLLRTLIERARAAGIGALVLEAGETNHAARRLYHEFGFARAGLRQGYYRSRSGIIDNALILRATI